MYGILITAIAMHPPKMVIITGRRHEAVMIHRCWKELLTDKKNQS